MGKKNKKAHFIGIGGIGISALARLTKHEGHIVSGSDITRTPLIDKLRKEGIKINIPHSAKAISDQDLVIHSAIIKEDNEEIVEAKRRGIPVLCRKEALKSVLADKEVFSVAGAHGKSTTSAILSTILESSALIGAESKNFGSNARFAEGKTLVFEADESDASFLCSNPNVAIVTNAEPEHMEYYDYDLDKFYGAYTEFLSLAKIRVINAEDKFLSTYKDEAIRLFPSEDIKNMRFLLKNGEPFTAFELKSFGEFFVWGFGEHIAIDASLSILAANLRLPIDTIRERLCGYRGIKKRFDVVRRTDKLVVIDDYGHHPTEIEATLQSAHRYKELLGLKSVTAIWQPHKYSRTLHNLDHFVRCFDGVDRLIILPVWAASEEPIELDLPERFKRYSPQFAPDFASVKSMIDEGVLIGFGAGNLTYQLRANR
ncbi:MAG: UDP-N-acetylmuramate--L-alanine ligase [Helicobacteraceae bacterium]|jgi:UDP-N-acetylmuramate--alanine ligase|nr:UDP-N-acetylmuramate--L-alanine ligase [Helicobacteraceae bacterium]